jgi:hypothetical protein
LIAERPRWLWLAGVFSDRRFDFPILHFCIFGAVFCDLIFLVFVHFCAVIEFTQHFVFARV